MVAGSYARVTGETNSTPAHASAVRLTRAPGDPHPYDVGTEGVQRYFKMTEECALATRMKALGQASLSP